VVLRQPSPYELVIGGMTCAACAARMQAKLNRLDATWPGLLLQPAGHPAGRPRLPQPLVAAATMTLSSVFVVWNSLRLRRFAPRPTSESAECKN
jgi:cation transport ATPase